MGNCVGGECPVPVRAPAPKTMLTYTIHDYIGLLFTGAYTLQDAYTNSPDTSSFRSFSHSGLDHKMFQLNAKYNNEDIGFLRGDFYPMQKLIYVRRIERTSDDHKGIGKKLMQLVVCKAYILNYTIRLTALPESRDIMSPLFSYYNNLFAGGEKTARKGNVHVNSISEEVYQHYEVDRAHIVRIVQDILGIPRPNPTAVNRTPANVNARRRRGSEWIPVPRIPTPKYPVQRSNTRKVRTSSPLSPGYLFNAEGRANERAKQNKRETNRRAKREQHERNLHTQRETLRLKALEERYRNRTPNQIQEELDAIAREMGYDPRYL
jgi:hypothetical protein